MSREITVAPERVRAGADTVGLSVVETDPGRWEITVMVIRAFSPARAMVQEGEVAVTLINAGGTTIVEARSLPGVAQAGSGISTTTTVRFEATIGDQRVAAVMVSYDGHTARFEVDDGASRA